MAALHLSGAQAEDPTDAFAAMLAPVRAAFLASLPDHIAAFEQFCRLESDEARQEMADGLARRAHRIFGVAETLSFPNLGRNALNLEMQLGAGVDLGALQSLVEDFVAQMHQALHS